VIVTDRRQVLEIYAEAAERRWVLPCLCSENLTTTEAILAAADEFGKSRGIPDLPITLAVTCLYNQRAQCVNRTHTKRWDTGLVLFTTEAFILAGPGGPYEHLRVMLHLDHIQHNEPLVTIDLPHYASINFDASSLPFEENIAVTALYVEMRGRDIVIEGACDVISQGGLTTPENAARYFAETGVDYAVANLGTEHRASGSDLRYHGDLARAIRDAVGPRMVLHGASSVPPDQLASLYGDGICKVNLWTALERDSSALLLAEMARDAKLIAGKDRRLSHFTTLYRQEIVYNKMKSMVAEYLDMWYV
jgi:fructose-bisphosphate aldolase class II